MVNTFGKNVSCLVINLFLLRFVWMGKPGSYLGVTSKIPSSGIGVFYLCNHLVPACSLDWCEHLLLAEKTLHFWGGYCRCYGSADDYW